MGGRIRQAHLDETTEVLNAIVMCALPSISAIKKVVPTTGLELENLIQVLSH